VPWPVVLAAGGPRERGRAYGAQTAPLVQRSIEIYERVFAHYAQLPWAEVRGRAAAFVEAIDAYDVQLLPELEGIAEGAGVEAEDVLAVNLRT
jgi:isopenicillin-N N-acyltransferase-like protein